jgi:UDP-glucose 6-dehydrogenase
MKIAVVGLSYVGLPLTIQFARADVMVLGLDVDAAQAACSIMARAILEHIPPETLEDTLKGKRVPASADFSRIKDLKAVIICVLTPFTRTRTRTVRLGSEHALLGNVRDSAQYYRARAAALIRRNSFSAPPVFGSRRESYRTGDGG